MRPKKPWRTIQAYPRRAKIRPAGVIVRPSAGSSQPIFAALLAVSLITLAAGAIGLAKGVPGRFVVAVAAASFVTACFGATREFLRR